MTQRETVSETTLSISKTINAPRELVFKAWTEPESLSRWWGAGPGFTTPIAEVDLRVGGTYKEIVSGEKLVYTWEWKNLGHEVLASSEGGTLLLRRDQGMWQYCRTPGAAGCSVDAIVKSELSPRFF